MTDFVASVLPRSFWLLIRVASSKVMIGTIGGAVATVQAIEAPAVGVAHSRMPEVGSAGTDVTNSKSALALASTHPSILFFGPDTQSSAKN